MDVLMSQRRPFMRPARPEPVQPQINEAPLRRVAAPLQPTQVVHLWMVPQSQPERTGETPARAALGYQAAKMAVFAK
ncbi:hypothetical protein [Pelagimonas varians]|uniref:Uncharacterized protein n=1 Tax=Pelagimonas varians TaxID=696760 RepID=A0A238KYM7_9RHOB|nr:hypothetical protein [Pelagimonas varians]PYG27620.1 hypothetical protein C8N36_115101 [Pelagimonas varians]SMX47827.1 hypothetical protein PEV8663_03647 [Pelagimonas varians]